MTPFHVSCRNVPYVPLHWSEGMPVGRAGAGGDVWLCDVSHPGDLRACTALLSAEERDKASRFKFEKDRGLYVAAHGLLRVVLSHYLAVPPAEVAFASGKGKPRLAGVHGSVQFNLSHTHGYVAVAVHPDQPVGVDVEKADPAFKWQDLIDYCLGDPERQALTGLETAAARHTFFNYWTRKEAFLKAIGVGLIDRLPDLLVTEGDQVVGLSSLKDAPDWLREWNIFTYDLAPFFCSVAQPAHLPAPTLYQVVLPGA